MPADTPEVIPEDIRTPEFYKTNLRKYKSGYKTALDDYKANYLSSRPFPSDESPYALNITSNSSTITAAQAETGIVEQSQELYKLRSQLELDQVRLGNHIKKLHQEITLIEKHIKKLKTEVRVLSQDSVSAEGKLGDAVNEYNRHLLAIWLMGVVCVGGAVTVGVTYRGIK